MDAGGGDEVTERKMVLAEKGGEIMEEHQENAEQPLVQSTDGVGELHALKKKKKKKKKSTKRVQKYI